MTSALAVSLTSGDIVNATATVTKIIVKRTIVDPDFNLFLNEIYRVVQRSCNAGSVLGNEYVILTGDALVLFPNGVVFSKLKCSTEMIRMCSRPLITMVRNIRKVGFVPYQKKPGRCTVNKAIVQWPKYSA